MRQWNGGPRGAKPRPVGLTITCFGPNPLPPTSRRQSKPSIKSRWPDAGIPKPADLTLRHLNLRFGVEVKHTDYNCFPLTLPALPAKKLPWNAINRTLIPHL